MTSPAGPTACTGATGTEARVCKDIARRQHFGTAKYGTTVANNPLALRAWLVHAYEETLDQAIYLRRAIEELDVTCGQPGRPIVRGKAPCPSRQA